VYSDYFVGPQTRSITGQSTVWRLYDSPYVDFDDPPGTADDYFLRVRWSGDAYITADKKEVCATFYPVIGPYDTRDRDLNEYHILLAKAAGIDGFFGEWQITNVLQFEPDCDPLVSPPPGSTTSNHSTLALLSMAQVGLPYDFTVGVTWTNVSLFQWYTFLCADPQLRRTYLEQGAFDLDHVLDTIYALNGPRINGRPLVLLWNTDSSVTSGSAGWFDKKDIWDLREILSTTYGQDPMLLGRDNHDYPTGALSGLVDPDLADCDPACSSCNTSCIRRGVEGFYSWHRFFNTCSGSCPPWTDVITSADQVGYLDRFLNGSGSVPGVKTLKNMGKIAMYMPSVTPHIDNHKGLSWGTGDKNYTPESDAMGSTLSQMFALWPDASVPVGQNTDFGFVNLFDDPEENASVEPTRELGYTHIKECAVEIALWKGLPAPTPSKLEILELPENLYRIRKGIGLVESAIARLTTSQPPCALSTALSNVHNCASLAAVSIATGKKTSAMGYLDSAEAHLANALNQLSVTRIDESWRVTGSPGNFVDEFSPNLAFPASYTPPAFEPTVGGRTLSSGNPTLFFDVTHPAFDQGFFVGTLTLEFYDTSAVKLLGGMGGPDPEYDEFVTVVVDAVTVDQGPLAPDVPDLRNILSYRTRRSDTWRSVQCDLVNAQFKNDLPQGTSDIADFLVRQTQDASATGVRSLRAVRIEGYVYQAPTGVPCQPAIPSCAVSFP